MKDFLRCIKKAYKSESKTMADWVYLANAVMAYGQYHDNWKQVGTVRADYEKWVESGVLKKALTRLTRLMKNVKRPSLPDLRRFPKPARTSAVFSRGRCSLTFQRNCKTKMRQF
mmetsp:Transcript_18669/g.46875  ORF Transcript_18669/g.46875 Transcript_18669/m.46875 type:complete len:114 (+) Transcript_18669:1604-1945(+)